MTLNYNKNSFYFISIILLQIFWINSCNGKFLLVPPTAPTRHQLLWGVGIPLPLQLSVTTGYVLKAQYYLADRPEQLYLKHDTWADITDVTDPGAGRRRRELFYDTELNQTYERYDEEVDGQVYYENVDLKLESMKHEDAIKKLVVHRESLFGQSKEHGVNRWHIYYVIEKLLEQRGFDGKACLLRMICEFSHAPITYYSGLLGEIAYTFLSPSTSNDEIGNPQQKDYLIAESFGKDHKPCERIYHECTESILSYFTDV